MHPVVHTNHLCVFVDPVRSFWPEHNEIRTNGPRLPSDFLSTMTTTLVSTDFSASAHWATDYAPELAKQLNTRSVAVHAYDPLPNAFSDGSDATTGGACFLAIRQLNRIHARMISVTKGSVDVSVVAWPGSPVVSLVDEAAKQQADLLVMSLVGDEPVKARQLDSLVTAMIPHTSVAMLLAPLGAVFTNPGTWCWRLIWLNPLMPRASTCPSDLLNFCKLPWIPYASKTSRTSRSKEPPATPETYCSISHTPSALFPVMMWLWSWKPIWSNTELICSSSCQNRIAGSARLCSNRTRRKWPG